MKLRAPKFYSSMNHYLLGVLGGKWNKVRLAMVTVFIDDSGTSPDQKVAIASAVIVESRRIVALDKEFSEMLEEEKFSYFHASACAAGNDKEGFGEWDEAKRRRVFGRVRNIVKKYGVNAFSIAIDRPLYDEIVPRDLRTELGRFHYTWAVGYLLEFLNNWAGLQKLDTPFEYVFDCMGKGTKQLPKREIESVMAKAEERRPGFYSGHYAFRCSKQTPALQCADLLAWSCYQFALFKLCGTLPSDIGKDSFWDFEGYRPRGIKWLQAIVQTREQLKAWVDEEMGK